MTAWRLRNLKRERREEKRKVGNGEKVQRARLGPSQYWGEKSTSSHPGTVQLPVPCPGGFGQPTRPPGETHTDRDTQPQRVTNRERHKEVGTERPTETKHRKVDKNKTGED